MGDVHKSLCGAGPVRRAPGGLQPTDPGQTSRLQQGIVLFSILDIGLGLFSKIFLVYALNGNILLI